MVIFTAVMAFATKELVSANRELISITKNMDRPFLIFFYRDEHKHNVLYFKNVGKGAALGISFNTGFDVHYTAVSPNEEHAFNLSAKNPDELITNIKFCDINGKRYEYTAFKPERYLNTDTIKEPDS